MKRRLFLKGMAWAVGGSALAACGSPAPPSAPSPTSAPTSAPTGAPASTAVPPTVTAAAGVPATPAATTPATAAPPAEAVTPTVVAGATSQASAPPTATAPVSAPAGPTATLAPSPAQAAAASPTPDRSAAGRPLPLFDTHVHYSEDAWDAVPVDQALALMDRAGTRLALVSSTPDDGSIRLHQAAPDRVIPVLRPYRTRADMGVWHQDPSLPTYLEERLTLGVHRGIGEFHLSGDQASGPVIGQVVRLAVARRLLLHAHADERAIEGLFAIDPSARVLWAHAGFAGSTAVQAMVERYPNLWVELAIRGDIGPGGRLDPGWRVVFEKHPDRYMVGTDSYVVARWTAMPAILGEVRAWLATLPPDVGEALAWRNAARLIGVDEAVFQPAQPR